MFSRSSCRAAVSVFACVVASPVVANELTLGIGVGLAPDYIGANEYGVVPLPSFSYKNDFFTLRTSGLGLEADLIPFEGIGAGPIVSYDTGRNDLRDVDDPVVRLLRTVDGSIEVGGFFEAAYPIASLAPGAPTLLAGRISAVQGLSGGHEGFVVEGRLGIIQPYNQWTFGLGVTTTYTSENYNEAYFGVTPADAIASGLPAYSPDGGFRDVGVAGLVSYKIDEKWTTSLIGSYSRLVGDAADSPVVTQRGDENQGFVGLSVSYKLF